MVVSNEAKRGTYGHDKYIQWSGSHFWFWVPPSQWTSPRVGIELLRPLWETYPYFFTIVQNFSSEWTFPPIFSNKIRKNTRDMMRGLEPSCMQVNDPAENELVQTYDSVNVKRQKRDFPRLHDLLAANKTRTLTNSTNWQKHLGLMSPKWCIQHILRQYVLLSDLYSNDRQHTISSRRQPAFITAGWHHQHKSSSVSQQLQDCKILWPWL